MQQRAGGNALAEVAGAARTQAGAQREHTAASRSRTARERPFAASVEGECERRLQADSSLFLPLRSTCNKTHASGHSAVIYREPAESGAAELEAGEKSQQRDPGAQAPSQTARSASASSTRVGVRHASSPSSSSFPAFSTTPPFSLCPSEVAVLPVPRGGGFSFPRRASDADGGAAQAAEAADVASRTGWEAAGEGAGAGITWS